MSVRLIRDSSCGMDAMDVPYFCAQPTRSQLAVSPINTSAGDARAEGCRCRPRSRSVAAEHAVRIRANRSALLHRAAQLREKCAEGLLADVACVCHMFWSLP
jgi:hypothetical protein